MYEVVDLETGEIIGVYQDYESAVEARDLIITTSDREVEMFQLDENGEPYLV
jgi:hypothetical protein